MRALVVSVLVLAASCSRHESPKNAPPWKVVGIGSTFESTTVTRMQTPFVHESKSTLTQTLLARTDSEATVKMQIVEGNTVSSQDVRVPLRQDELPPHDGSTVTTATEPCATPAGRFQCTRTTVEIRQGDVTRSTSTWRAPQIPVPIRSVVSNENMTITTELTRMTIAR